MRNYHSIPFLEYYIDLDWSVEEKLRARRFLTSNLYDLFETDPRYRVLRLATGSERSVLVAFRHWYLLVMKGLQKRSFVYVNVNTGRSIVVKPIIDRGWGDIDLLVGSALPSTPVDVGSNPCVNGWTELNFMFAPLVIDSSKMEPPLN